MVIVSKNPTRSPSPTAPGAQPDQEKLVGTKVLVPARDLQLFRLATVIQGDSFQQAVRHAFRLYIDRHWDSLAKVIAQQGTPTQKGAG
ncbi:MAG: hypothetical protein Q8R28_13525 [Dehalococcoidia bacterium]|nr:hypothetical protein [Dehalococcoidia bacterium]